MPTKIKKMINCKPQIEKSVGAFLFVEGKKVSELLEQTAYDLLKETLENRTVFSGFTAAIPLSKDKSINKNKTGIDAGYRVFIADSSSGSPHKIWHYVSEGVPDKKVINTHVYPIIKKARTTPKNLKVGNFNGFSGFRTAKAGDIKKGFEGRFWYLTSLEEIEKQIAGGKFGDLVDIKITTTEK